MKAEELELKVAVEEIGRVKTFLRSVIGDAGMDERLSGRLVFVVEEAVANVVNHSGASAMTLKAWQEDDRLKISVTDDGVPFDPTQFPPPNLNVPGMERQEGGLGIHYIRTMASGMAYRRESGRNILTMSFEHCLVI